MNKVKKVKSWRKKAFPTALDAFNIHLKAAIIDALYELIRYMQNGAEVHLVIGSKWGDEGKGKCCAFFSREANLAIRATGGANAGHTVVLNIGGKKIKIVLHLLPAGVAYDHMFGLIGQGVAVDFDVLFEEIKKFEELGIDVKRRLRISNKAIVLMPYHKELDVLYEGMRSKKIGTTKKGIGPAYEDKTKRDGLRVQDLFLPEEVLAKKIKEGVQRHNILFRECGMKEQVVNAELLAKQYHDIGEKIADIVVDGHTFVREFAKNPKKRIVVEGAQAVFLSIEVGDYPFCTSSDSNTNGMLSGSHLSISDLPKGTLVGKAYDSRVGNGPFYTELKSHIDKEGNLIPYESAEAYLGDLLRDYAHEYGATTGRPRRVGWLDAIATKYAFEVSGARDICINHIDTLGKFGLQYGKIAMCIGYKYKGKVITTYPTMVTSEVKPIYKWFDGWEITSEMKHYKDLPKNCKEFIRTLESITGHPVRYIGIGPEDNDVIIRKF